MSHLDVLTQYRSPYEAFTAAAARRPEAPFLIAPASAELSYARDGFRISYGDMLKRVESLKAELAAAGYGCGARVALLLDNHPEFFEHWLALNALGVSIAPINPDLRTDELSYQLHKSRADLLIASEERMAMARQADLGRARLIGPGAAIPASQSTVTGQNDASGNECALLFTSGSTAQPKGCVLSNRYFLGVADWYVNQGGTAAVKSEDEINLTPLPMFHMNALGASAVGMMVIGGAIVPLDRFSATRWWASVADSKATIVHCLGVIPAILLQLPVSESERQHQVRFAFAPAVDVRHRATFEERYGIPIVDAWAMTETGGAAATTTAQEPGGFASRCIGRPAATMDYRLVNEEGEAAKAGEPGELLVRAKGDDPRAGFFTAYLDDPTSTAEAWDGGWFHTGDYVSAGPDGLLYFFDRKKSIVRRSGENIAVLEVESALHKLPMVEATAVTPVPDDLRGEEVFAFVVRSESAAKPDAALAESIVQGAAETLAYHKVPAYIAFVDSLPLSSTKKIARGEVKTLATTAVREQTAFDFRALKAQLRKAPAGKN
ncbi:MULTISPECIES: AMP-binding protein [unclassified Beijerinckia]|uniref:AMP-binding protein n=1 Tax=unclassified Beijerinckia TaxID=2638183 RepID=UPI00089C609A|nr:MULTISPECIES: AMP-binding protein [unclassified Beijerinckia]MDH7797585.1 acyl-CoA synthetase (AMP-forming)/AMP-acid ligase II [Beijerinckia sp. GAS462]SEC91457.1 Acyl-CoA synthetase (AMP-forming)/AMP-acid ligase II [Beijerinckia sp. 28-YEA-48]